MPKYTFSNILIFISLVFTIFSYMYPEVYILGINNIFLDRWLYHIYIIQFFTWTFLHGNILHFLMNSIFIYYFWNNVEYLIWKKRFFSFFIFTTVFIWIMVTNFSNVNTVWISWFAMALLSYYTLELKSKNNPEYKWGITALIINIWIGLHPQISLLWHLFWAVAWLIFYLINKTWWDFSSFIKKIRNKSNSLNSMSIKKD